MDRQVKKHKEIQVSEGYPLAAKHRQMDKSGYKKNPSKQEALTSLRVPMARQVKE
jgi:hypothetical protein